VTAKDKLEATAMAMTAAAAAKSPFSLRPVRSLLPNISTRIE